MAGYTDKISKDVARWTRDGLISADTAAALRHDIETHHGRGLSFGYVLAMMAALLFGAAVLIMVAANWESIPRLGRVGALFALIAGGYVGGAALKLRGNDAFGESAWLVAAAAFGGSIALIGQMYHLSGDEVQAILIWCVGTMVAAAALRSPLLTVAAVGLATVWMAYPVFEFSIDIQHWFVALLAVLWGLSVWTGSVTARHAILLALLFYGMLVFIDGESIGVLVAMAVVSAGVLAAVVLRGDLVQRVTGLGAGLAIDALLGFLTAMFALQFQFIDEGHFVWLAALKIAGIAAALVFAGRTSRGIRWLAYLGFAGEICLVYVATIGTMLGTAGFFLLAAVGLGLLAFVIIRIERRLAPPAASIGEPA